MQQQADETKDHLDYLARQTAVETATGFHRIMRNVVKALRGGV